MHPQHSSSVIYAFHSIWGTFKMSVRNASLRLDHIIDTKVTEDLSLFSIQLCLLNCSHSAAAATLMQSIMQRITNIKHQTLNLSRFSGWS